MNHTDKTPLSYDWKLARLIEILLEPTKAEREVKELEALANPSHWRSDYSSRRQAAWHQAYLESIEAKP